MNNRVQCENCRWIGTQEECVKEYVGSPLGEEGEGELQLLCPVCGNENLIILEDNLAVPV